jgi:hypothetical protein
MSLNIAKTKVMFMSKIPENLSPMTAHGKILQKTERISGL